MNNSIADVVVQNIFCSCANGSKSFQKCNFIKDFTPQSEGCGDDTSAPWIVWTCACIAAILAKKYRTIIIYHIVMYLM